MFEFNGHTYAWDYKIFIGAMHTLKNLDTNEIVAICQLKAGVTTQSITAWGLRYACLLLLAPVFVLLILPITSSVAGIAGNLPAHCIFCSPGRPRVGVLAFALCK